MILAQSTFDNRLTLVHETTFPSNGARAKLKRDDLWAIGLARGAKARAITKLLFDYHAEHGHDPAGVITCGSRHSVQIVVAAMVCRHFGIKYRAHVPAAKAPSEEVDRVKALGYEVVEHRPGYMNVVAARGRQMAQDLGYYWLPPGLLVDAAKDLIAHQAANLGRNTTHQIVVCAGSGTTAAGVLRGLLRARISSRVDIALVGADCREAFAAEAQGYRNSLLGTVAIHDPRMPYDKPAPAYEIAPGVKLDPYYEAKCLPYLNDGGLLWITGSRHDWPPL